MLVRYRVINNKGVLDGPWTKWRVLRAMSSTLKFQFTVNPESLRFDYSVRQKIGDPGPIKLRTNFPLTSVLSKPPQLQYGTNKSVFGQFFCFFRFRYCRFLEICYRHLVLKYRRKHNKGVLGRPWTTRRVLRAISSTLKFQFTENHEN